MIRETSVKNRRVLVKLCSTLMLCVYNSCGTKGFISHPLDTVLMDVPAGKETPGGFDSTLGKKVRLY